VAGEATIWEEHEARVSEIIAECDLASRGSTLPGAMLYDQFDASLFHAQRETAKKLGKQVDDPTLKAKFAAEDKVIRAKCGL
jgi:hypothetical protein